MTLGKLLLKKRDGIIRSWIDHALAAYPADSAALFARDTDPFANPIGHGLRVGARKMVEALADGKTGADAEEHLYEIVRVRAVQQMPASQAVGFVFRLKDAVRSAIGEAATSPELASELRELDGRIDQLALAAFDAYTRCREQVSELRINEVKRSVSWVVDRINRRASDRETQPEEAATQASEDVNVRRESVR